MTFVQRKSLGLALGGGGARGLVHVGVLSRLVEHGIKVDYVAGTSAGAVAGAFFSSGMPMADILSISRGLRWKNFAKIRLSRRGMFTSKPVQELIEKYLGTMTFSSMKTPFVVLATDVLLGEGVWFHQPHQVVSEAVRASCSFPGVFEPALLEGRYYFDGGASYNLPCQVARDMGAEVVIGVDVIPRVQYRVMPHHIPALIDRGLDCLLRNMSRYTHQDGDLVLTPIRERVSSFAVRRAARMIDVGMHCVDQELDQIKALLS